MRIKLTSIFVDDQTKALKFYTEILGFVKKQDMPAGKFKWLTVISPEEPEGPELLLEPNDNQAAQTFQKAVFEQKIPTLSLFVDDLQKEYERMLKAGVAFTMPPTNMGPAIVAIFDDTCGNFVQLIQV